MHKKIKVLLILFSIMALGAIAGCGGDDPPIFRWGNVTLYNDTSYSIDELYLAPIAEPDWGDNRLGSDVPSGDSVTISGLAPKAYDAQIVIKGAYSVYFAYRYNIAVEAWETYDLTTINSDFSGSLQIVNDDAAAYINGIYVSKKGSGSWGPNQITSSIGPGRSLHLFDLDSGSYDVKIVWDAGADSVYSTSVLSLVLVILNVN